MPAQDVTDLLRCEQRVFFCTLDDHTEIIVYVENSEEALLASLPMFGIEPQMIEGNPTRASFSVN